MNPADLPTFGRPPETDKQPDPIATDMPEDTRYLGDRLDGIRAALGAVVDATVRQESPAPSFYFAMPAATGRNDFPQTTRVRLLELVISVGAASQATITIGTALFWTIAFAAAGTIRLPFPHTIAEGTDVVVATTVETPLLAVFTGYPEADPRRKF
jgi:hypothetical protein